MLIALTGASGLVGAFIHRDLVAAGHRVVTLGRSGDVRFELGDRPDLSGVNALIHCAFDHVPGRYRGGEGDDPERFIRRNVDGTAALFEAARDARVGRIVFLSTRAVYGDYPAGTVLTTALPPRPDTLYGQVKFQGEQALASLTGSALSGLSLRATGVYGPPAKGQRHKWADLFDDFRAGHPIPPRRGTEVHGDDLSRAIRLLWDADAASGVWNLSDFTLDHHDLLGELARVEGLPHPPPPPATNVVSAMDTTPLRDLGWTPGGPARLWADLPRLARGI